MGLPTYTVPTATCPYCGVTADRAASIKEEPPKADDITVCVACLGVCIFDEQLHLREPTEHERALIEGSDRFQKLMEIMREFKRRREH